jgi:hypothetical protein
MRVATREPKQHVIRFDCAVILAVVIIVGSSGWSKVLLIGITGTKSIGVTKITI